MKVYRERWEVLSTAIQIVSDRRVTVYELEGQFGKPVKEYGVNWSACGTQTVEETEKFKDLLDMGIDIAAMLNRHEVQFMYTDEGDPEIDSKERYEEVGETLLAWLIAKDYRRVEAWIIAGSKLYDEEHK